MDPKDFISQRDFLRSIADNTELNIIKRVNALAHLYEYYRNDVHNQARIVRQIEELTA